MKFPYTGWVLMPSFKPAEVILVEQHMEWTGNIWVRAESGTLYKQGKVFGSKEDAIQYGFEDLAKQQAALDKKQANIHKRRAALEKAQK